MARTQYLYVILGDQPAEFGTDCRLCIGLVETVLVYLWPDPLHRHHHIRLTTRLVA